MILKNYRGCRIFIHDDEEDIEIESTTILSHNMQSMLITVQGNQGMPKRGSSVKVLILTGNGVHEFKGTITRFNVSDQYTEIALYRGELKKESRMATRYRIDTLAHIKQLFIHEKSVPILKPIKVHILNLSATGALLKASPECFHIGAVFEMSLPIGDQDTTMFCKIVRIKEMNSQETEYGCKFLMVRKE